MASQSQTDSSIETINQDNEELSSDLAQSDNAKLASLLAPSTTTTTAPAKDQRVTLTHPKEEEAAAKGEEQKKAAAAKSAAAQKALQAQIQAVQDSPWTQLSNGLVNQYKTAETPTAAAISGTATPTAQEGAANSALSSLGLSSSSPAGSWLTAQTQAAQQTAAPVSQAMAQEGAQYQAEEQPIENALAAGGEANALAVNTAPEASWVQALASHVQSNLSLYGTVPTAALSSLSPAVAEALKLSGGYPGSSAAGTTQIQNIGPSATGGSKVDVPSSASSALASAGSTGSVPAPSPAPGG
jgi:hypothetical protein